MINTKSLRCLIGGLGMALPFIVAILSLVFGYGFPHSISATYFRDCCIAPFMIILGSAGILLFTYKGYDNVDNVLNSLAAVCAICICLFPCASTRAELIGTFQLPRQISGWIHNGSAAGFFGILAYNSLFQFTKGSNNPTPNKLKRNIIFRICGVGMILSFVLLVLACNNIITIPYAIWTVEAIALFFFGVSWITKADCIPFLFCDPKEK